VDDEDSIFAVLVVNDKVVFVDDELVDVDDAVSVVELVDEDVLFVDEILFSENI
jgi:hypothetical protein